MGLGELIVFYALFFFCIAMGVLVSPVLLPILLVVMFVSWRLTGRTFS